MEKLVCDICKAEYGEGYFHSCPPVNTKYIAIPTDAGCLRVDRDTGEIVKLADDFAGL